MPKVKMLEPSRAPRRRRLTLHNLISEGAEIWVRNLTGIKVKKQAGNIVMQAGQGNMIYPIAIPPGKDPVCLTDQVTPKLLEDCMDLFQHLNNGALELLDPDEAISYYRENKKRKAVIEKKVKQLLTRPRGAPVEKKKAEQTVQLHPKLNAICQRAKHGAITDREALESLMEQEDALTTADFSYLLTNGVFDAVKKWAEDKVSKMSDQEDEEEEVIERKSPKRKKRRSKVEE